MDLYRELCHFNWRKEGGKEGMKERRKQESPSIKGGVGIFLTVEEQNFLPFSAGSSAYVKADTDREHTPLKHCTAVYWAPVTDFSTWLQ